MKLKILIKELRERTHTLEEALSENSVLKQTVLELEKENDNLSYRQAYLLAAYPQTVLSEPLFDCTEGCLVRALGSKVP